MGKIIRERLPRYSRAKNPPPMRLTERDKRIIENVYLYRFLTRDQIRLLNFENASITACQRRLSLLYHNQYLSAIQKPIPSGYGSSKRVYCLSKRGIEAIAFMHDGLDPRKIKWSRKQNKVEMYFLEHTLAINDVRVAFTVSARRLDFTLEWIPESELKALKEKVDDPDNPGKSLAVTPDSYIILEGESKRAFFFLEADRATESSRRWKDKIRGYIEYVRSGKYQERYKTDVLRVLTVTTTKERLENLFSATKNIYGANFFWFTDRKKLKGNNIIKDPIWQRTDKKGIYQLWYS